MNNYNLLINDKELNDIIDSINEINKDNLLACHGRCHTTFVINAIEKLLTSLNFDRKTIELGKIAGLLHDIGTIDGKKDMQIEVVKCAYNFWIKQSYHKKVKI